MSVTLKELKRQALSLMKTKVKPAPLLVALVFAVLLSAVSYFQATISGSTVVTDEEMMAELSERARSGDMPSFAEFMEAVDVKTPKATGFSSFLDLALQALTIILSAGFSLYALRFVRQAESAEMGNLLDGFGQIYRVTMVYLLRSLLVGLGLICLIVPGVLLFYSYRQAEYLMWDHPDWPPVRCLQASRLLMHGRRGRLFLLDLSFLLLLYLSSVPFSLADWCHTRLMYGAMIGAILLGCCVSAFVYLYMELSHALWYNYCLQTPETKSESEDISPWES